jgi:hypothetical protein
VDLDVYDGDQHRVVRLSGEEKGRRRVAGRHRRSGLRRVARAGMDQLAAFLATSRAPPTAGRRCAAANRMGSLARRLDAGGPGIFRIFGREPAGPRGNRSDAARRLPPRAGGRPAAERPNPGGDRPPQRGSCRNSR